MWEDWKGNSHILDYVIEEGGSETRLGRPKAFIETAWRRYTRHSKNKAQEIQAAITPLAETYQDSHPFLGAVVAGEFTDPSLEQFKSHGFSILYCPYETMLQAYASEGLDISTEETTDREVLQAKADALEKLTQSQQERIALQIRQLHSEQFTTFFDSLRISLRRRIEYILVLPLSGTPQHFDSIQSAVHFISNHDSSMPSLEFVKYELNIRYSNGDEVRGTFHDKEQAIEFLSRYSN